METANYHECKECRWAIKINKGTFVCHRFPPVSYGDRYGRFGWEFPVVRENVNDCFCGEQERVESEDDIVDDLRMSPPEPLDDCVVDNPPWCKTCRWSVEKEGDQGRRYFVCHRNPPVQRNDLDGRTRYQFPVVRGMDAECFCGEYEDVPEVAE